MRSLVQLAVRGDVTLRTPSAVVAQIRRDGLRQARLARLFKAGLVRETPLDPQAARSIGVVCGRTGSSDVIDGHVALLSRQHKAPVVKDDPDDLAGVPQELIRRL